jgi:hypothetical protein
LMHRLSFANDDALYFFDYRLRTILNLMNIQIQFASMSLLLPVRQREQFPRRDHVFYRDSVANRHSHSIRC